MWSSVLTARRFGLGGKGFSIVDFKVRQQPKVGTDGTNEVPKSRYEAQTTRPKYPEINEKPKNVDNFVDEFAMLCMLRRDFASLLLARRARTPSVSSC